MAAAAARLALRTVNTLPRNVILESLSRQSAARGMARPPLVSLARGLRTPPAATSAVQPVRVLQEVVEDSTQAEKAFTQEVIEKVDEQVRTGLAGRLFALVYLQGKQHLVTPEDLVVVQTSFPPNIGDKIRLEKVMMVGGRDFTLLGRPLLGQDLVYVEATVVEKTLSHCRVYFYNRRRKNSRRTKFNRETHTLLRINRVEITHGINERQDVAGTDGRIF